MTEKSYQLEHELAKDQIYDKYIEPLVQQIGAICERQGWELSCLVAFDVDESIRAQYGTEKKFIQRSTTLSRNAQAHGMSLVNRATRS